MESTRILTEQDKQLVAPFLNLLQDGLMEIEPLYADKRIVQEAREKYSQDYLIRELAKKNPENRFWASLNNGSLDGLLVEGFEKVGPENSQFDVSKINWIFAKYKGQGIGTVLMNYLISQASIEKRDAVSLAVSENNSEAIRLYNLLGFREIARENGIIGMYKFLNPKMDPKNWKGDGYIGPR